MYWPRHRPQLTGIPTESVDCGTRSVQMALDDASRGAITPSIKKIRTVMEDWDATNYYGWDKVVDELGAPKEILARRTNDIDEVRQHLKDKMGVIWAVHYGMLRRDMPRKTGSETFDGYHAIFSKALRSKDDPDITRSFDSLLDGRYPGCPKGPVWVPFYKMKRAALKVGRDIGAPGTVQALLVYPPEKITGIEVPDPEPVMSLTDIVSDLLEMQDRGTLTDPGADSLIRVLQLLIGPGNPEADRDTLVEDATGLRSGGS